MHDLGMKMHEFAKLLWPINRSITGEGVRETLSIIKKELPSLKVYEVPSGQKVFDWVVPQEWNVREAYIIAPNGKKICDFKKCNLHLMGYSIPFSGTMSLDELQNHLYSLPDQPSAIPYVTSYYEARWGFCISEDERKKLKAGQYSVVIDSELHNGSLTYGELVIKGASDDEIFLSTYICHPSMANNEISGPAVTTFLSKWLYELKDLRYSYRIIFIPETIGSITYLSSNLEHLKKHVIAGFNLTCVGDDRSYSYLPSRRSNTISDKIATHVLKWLDKGYKSYSWGDRGSDERQYCAPNIDLPIVSMMRTKYLEYPEYHTSLDDLVNVVTPSGLKGGYNAHKLAIEALEKNIYPRSLVLGEPQLGKRGLYPTVSAKSKNLEVKLMMDVVSWSDGENSLLEIAEKCNVPIWKLYPIVEKLIKHQILK